jgi:hypothetical protein
MSTEKEEEESTVSGSGSSNAKDEGKVEYWHGFGEEPRRGLVKLHNQTESEAVREWEARIKKDREEANRKKNDEKQHEHENEKFEDEIKPH